MGLVGHRSLLLASGVALCATCMTVPASAQDENASAGQPTLLQRLILGFGRPKVATDTPTAVTVIEQEEIDEEIPDTAADLAEKIPGVNAAGSASNLLGQNFNIRGFGPQELGSNQEGRNAILVDGATKFYESYRMGGLFTDSELFKRVEVLRGPAAGTLYGSGVLGGVVNFTLKDASDFLEDGQNAALRLKMIGDSNQEGYKASAILAARMGENAEFLAAGNYTDFQNIIVGNGEEMLGTGQQLPSGLIKGTFHLDEARERVLRVSYNRTDGEGLTSASTGGTPICENASYIAPYPDCYPWETADNTPTLIDRNYLDETAVISYRDEASDNPWLDLNVNLSYSKQQNGQEDFLNADMSYAYYELKADNTFEWTGDNFENYLTVGLAGKYHQRRREDLDGTSSNSHPEGNETAFGVFAQNEYIWNERLTAIAGMRIDWHELEPAGSTLYNSSGMTLRSPAPENVSDVAFAPKLALHYKLTDTFSVFGSYAYTERLPGIDEEYDWSSSYVQNDLKKERANSVEVGFGQDASDIVLPGDQFAYKVTGFYNHIDDYIVRGGSGMSDWVNTDEAEIYGVELEAAYDSDFIFANLAASAIRGNNLTTGDPLDSIAPDEIALTVGGKLPDHYLRFGWTGRFVAKTDYPMPVYDPPTYQTPNLELEALRRAGFNVHDIFVSWKPEEGHFAGYEVTARVDNIFDAYYQEWLQTSGPAKGRTFKVSLAKTFTF